MGGFNLPDMAFSLAAWFATRIEIMAAWRQAMELAIGEEDAAALSVIARSRSEPARRVERARMLLAYQENPSFFAVAQAAGVHHQTVQRCVERALAHGPIVALDDLPRPGRQPTWRGWGAYSQ
jgi:hypothetical protein